MFAGVDMKMSVSSILWLILVVVAPVSFAGERAAAVSLRNWGIDNQEFPSHINAKKAWGITRGKKQIVVAVIDTGIDPTHPDLKDNLWKKNGTDEYGYDFVLNKKNPGDVHRQGHGTHVAGIIGATAKNHAGAIGVAPNISIMAIRYYSDSNSDAQHIANTVKAINYAIDNGANVINYSGGGSSFSPAEYQAIKRAEQKGILFVTAAGNNHADTDESENAYYPSSYGLPNIISVAATNIHNQLVSCSNWGVRHVHVAAPGESIFSTLPNGRYGYLTGTSQATAFVSGVAALILSEHPGLTPMEVRKIIMNSSAKIDTLEGKTTSSGRVDAFSALRYAAALYKKSDAQTKESKLAGSNPQAPSTVVESKKRSVAFKKVQWVE